ncbi:hypothetical protein M422DRAFT_26526 [Sphaerobolus stellatus SS14]|nr:hypothetical protein M422DRAFT_26526 [Sphaerobolus stellatus SS14]
MATELVCFEVKSTFAPQDCESSFKHFDPRPPGFQSLGWGRAADDPSRVHWFQNWDSVEAHIEFSQSAPYPTFVNGVMGYAAGAPSIYHAYLMPFPPTEVLKAQTVEIISLVLKEAKDFVPGAPALEIEKFMQEVAKDPGYRAHSYGLKHEDQSVHIILIGWDSSDIFVNSKSKESLFQGLFDEDESSFVRVVMYHQ